ncbi:hypothetical protein QL285_089066 [Trifolium repens]|nr:hypothetical protein QL285_089066 [Trifolium repens]
MVFALQQDNRIKVSNMRENEFITLKDDTREDNYFDDIIHYKGQVYVVDKLGTISWIIAFSMKLVQFSLSNIYYCFDNINMWFNKKQLVEYDGSLYVVNLKADFVEVYKLDQEWGKWLEVKDLGDASLVLGRDSNFASLAQDYYGCEENCIYFFQKTKVFCFNLKNSKSKPADIFWPLPNLFHSMGG